MRSEPLIPKKEAYPDREVRETIIHNHCRKEVGELISILQKIENEDSNAAIEVYEDGSGCYYESDTPSVSLCVVSFEDTYQDALDKYRDKLEKYNIWHKENEEAVKKELELRATEKNDADLRKADRLEREAKAIRKKCITDLKT